MLIKSCRISYIKISKGQQSIDITKLMFTRHPYLAESSQKASFQLGRQVSTIPLSLPLYRSKVCMVDRYVKEEYSRFITINLMVSCTNRKPELSQQRMGRCRSLVGKEGDRICFPGDLQKFSQVSVLLEKVATNYWGPVTASVAGILVSAAVTIVLWAIFFKLQLKNNEDRHKHRQN